MSGTMSPETQQTHGKLRGGSMCGLWCSNIVESVVLCSETYLSLNVRDGCMYMGGYVFVVC